MNYKFFIGYFIAEIIMIFVAIKFFEKVLKKNIKFNLRNIIFIFLTACLLIFNNYFNFLCLRYPCCILIMIIFLKFLFKEQFYNIIGKVILFSILSVVLELILTTLLILIPNIKELNNNVLIKSTFSIIHSIIIFALSFTPIIKIFQLKFKKEDFNFNKIIMITMLFLNIILVYRSFSLNNFYMLSLSILCCIFMIYCIKLTLNDKKNIEILKLKNNNINAYYKTFTKTIDEYRELKHNLKNELYAIKTNLPKEYQDGLNKFITKYNKNYEWINKTENMPEGIQGLIYLKEYEAKQKKVKIYLNTDKNINIQKDYLSLCEILGILLDNAIEAAQNTKNKIVYIDITEGKNKIEFKVINQYSNKIDINKIGNKNYSTKKIKSGIGLNYIEKIKKKNINVNFFIKEDLFISTLVYKYK